MIEATVVITPRDRYSGIIECLQNLYDCTHLPFKVIVLDLDYPKKLKNQIREFVGNKPNATVFPLGRVIPMEALRQIRSHIKTPYTIFLDNDSNVTQGWLGPLLETARTGAAVVSPLTLEKEGMDIGAPLRNHIYTSEIRVVDVQDKPYLIEYKPYRRALPHEIPKHIAETDLFELHCVLFNTKVLQEIELPQMVIREHIDIGMQIRARGEKLLAEPRSVIEFDNLGTPMTRDDMKFFWFRWSYQFAKESADLFEKRWDYRFYSEQSTYNWIFRRKVFVVSRYLGLPVWAANKITSVAKKLFCRDWDPLPDPLAMSRRFYEVAQPSMQDKVDDEDEDEDEDENN